MAARLLLLAAASLAALGGCATNTKGSWSCAVDRGGVCSSISDIDHNVLSGPASKHSAAADPDPVIDGAVPAKLWSQAGWSAGPISDAPLRENEVTVKVAIAPWIDTAGDYHAGAEVFAVMRRGGWFVSPPASQRRVQLSVAPTRPQSAPYLEVQASPGPSSASDAGGDLAKFAPVDVPTSTPPASGTSPAGRNPAAGVRPAKGG